MCRQEYNIVYTTLLEVERPRKVKPEERLVPLHVRVRAQDMDVLNAYAEEKNCPTSWVVRTILKTWAKRAKTGLN